MIFMEDYSSLYLCSVQYGSPKSQISIKTWFNLIDFAILLNNFLFDSLTLSRYKPEKDKLYNKHDLVRPHRFNRDLCRNVHCSNLTLLSHFFELYCVAHFMLIWQCCVLEWFTSSTHLYLTDSQLEQICLMIQWLLVLFFVIQ